MAITYKWIIKQLECYPQQNNKTNVVFRIHWIREATDGTHSAQVYGCQDVELEPNAPFTPYSDLKFEQIVSWVEKSLGTKKLTEQVAGLNAAIQAQITPPVIQLPLPWGDN